jgi:hypothetical protein
MVSKSRKQRQVQKAKRAVGDNEPQKISTGKSVHLKKVRPNMKGKMKIRMGHESSDIYEGFENSKQINWQCPTCGRVGRVVGFCISCEAEKIAVRDELKQQKTTTSSLVPSSTQGVRSSKAAKTAPKK